MLSRVILPLYPKRGRSLAPCGFLLTTCVLLGSLLGCEGPGTIDPVEVPRNQPPGPATNPEPGSGAAGVGLEPVLGWTGGGDPDGDAVVYEVYLGTAEPLMQIGTTSDSMLAIAIRLAHDTDFLWRVVASDVFGSFTESDTWSFHTTIDPHPESNDPPVPITDPVPADGAEDVPSAVELQWRGGGDPEGLEIVFEVFLAAGHAPLAPIGYTSDSSFDLNELDSDFFPGTTFTWRIVARDPEGLSATSPVWSFTTRPNLAPAAPADPNPMDGSTGIPVTAVLSWSRAGDPEGDPVSYDVHLGAGAESPSFVATVTDTFYVAPEVYVEGAAYVWQIVARDPIHRTSGPLWHFTTAVRPNSPPPAPESPSPAHRSTGVDPAVVLSWDDGVDPDGDPIAYYVFLGESNPPLLAGVQPGATYDPPGELAPETTYFWQIVARDDHGGETPGAVWSFTTAEPPNTPPSLPSNLDPANGAGGVARDVVLNWSGGDDPDGDPITFDVYFGTTDPPGLAYSGSSATYDPPGDLDPLTSYYWRVVARDDEGGETSTGTLMFITAP